MTDTVYMIDTSGSTADCLSRTSVLDIIRRAVLEDIESHPDRVGIITFGMTTNRLTPKLVTPQEAGKILRDAVLVSHGSTPVWDAVEAAHALLDGKGDVVIITDGYPDPMAPDWVLPEGLNIRIRLVLRGSTTMGDALKTWAPLHPRSIGVIPVSDAESAPIRIPVKEDESAPVSAKGVWERAFKDAGLTDEGVKLAMYHMVSIRVLAEDVVKHYKDRALDIEARRRSPADASTFIKTVIDVVCDPRNR